MTKEEFRRRYITRLAERLKTFAICTFEATKDSIDYENDNPEDLADEEYENHCVDG